MSKALRKILDVTRNQLRIFRNRKIDREKYPLYSEHLHEFDGMVTGIIKGISEDYKQMVLEKEESQFKLNVPKYGIVIGISKYKDKIAVKINYRIKADSWKEVQQRNIWEVFGIICWRPEYYDKLKPGDFIEIENFGDSTRPPDIKHLYGIYGQDFNEFPSDIREIHQVDYRIHQKSILQVYAVDDAALHKIHDEFAITGNSPMKLDSIPADVKLFERDADSWTKEDGNKDLNEKDEEKILNLISEVNLYAPVIGNHPMRMPMMDHRCDNPECCDQGDKVEDK